MIYPHVKEVFIYVFERNNQSSFTGFSGISEISYRKSYVNELNKKESVVALSFCLNMFSITCLLYHTFYFFQLGCVLKLKIGNIFNN